MDNSNGCDVMVIKVAPGDMKRIMNDIRYGDVMVIEVVPGEIKVRDNRYGDVMEIYLTSLFTDKS